MLIFNFIWSKKATHRVVNTNGIESVENLLQYGTGICIIGWMVKSRLGFNINIWILHLLIEVIHQKVTWISEKRRFFSILTDFFDWLRYNFQKLMNLPSMIHDRSICCSTTSVASENALTGNAFGMMYFLKNNKFKHCSAFKRDSTSFSKTHWRNTLNKLSVLSGSL